MNIQQHIAEAFLNIINRARVALHADSLIIFPFENLSFWPAPIISGEILHPEMESLFKENGLAGLVLNVGTIYLEGERQYLEVLRTAGSAEYEDGVSKEDFWHREKLRSSIFFRLQSGADCVGVMFINYQTRQTFSPPTKELVEGFALLIVSAITTGQLLRENFAFVELQRRDSLSLTLSEIIASQAHNSDNLLSTINMLFTRLDLYLRKSADGRLERENLERLVADIREPLTELTADFIRMKEYRRLTEFEEELCRIEELIDNTLQMLSPKLLRNRIMVRKSYRPTPLILCDRNQIQHLLLNLFINALDAMGRKGILSVGTDLDGNGNFIKIQITDTGVGISPDLHSEIFQPYFSSKPHSGRTGLGLPISRYIVEAHDGRMEFTSTSGKGTSFFIYLPVRTQSEDGQVETL